MSKWYEFENGKSGIKAFIDEATTKLRISRKELATLLDCHNSTLHSWIPKGKIPTKYYKRIQELIEEGIPSNQNLSNENSLAQRSLSDLSLDELINEVESRGYRVSLERKKI
jgi:hypothetical protein